MELATAKPQIVFFSDFFFIEYYCATLSVVLCLSKQIVVLSCIILFVSHFPAIKSLFLKVFLKQSKEEKRDSRVEKHLCLSFFESRSYSWGFLLKLTIFFILRAFTQKNGVKIGFIRWSLDTLRSSKNEISIWHVASETAKIIWKRQINKVTLWEEASSPPLTYNCYLKKTEILKPENLGQKLFSFSV